jgi:hypothetical protein
MEETRMLVLVAAALKVGAEDAVLVVEEAGRKVGQQPGELRRATMHPPVLLPTASDKGEARRRRGSPHGAGDAHPMLLPWAGDEGETWEEKDSGDG